VLDEADRLFTLGFAKELDDVLAQLPERCQKLLFSATFPPAVRGFAHRLLRDPIRVTVQADTDVEPTTIAQRAVLVDPKRRTKLLLHLLKTEGWTGVLAFVASRERAQQLAAELQHAGMSAASLHGDLSQQARTEALADFKSGRLQVLVATDLAARGIDVPRLAAVVNYDLPRSPVDYVHRIGRTGRAGEGGVALSFVSTSTDAHFSIIERSQGRVVAREQIPGFIPLEKPTFVQPTDAQGGVKGRRKSKKDKVREAAARAAETARPKDLL
jgi:superfamily II DNA/RNA helicase